MNETILKSVDLKSTKRRQIILSTIESSSSPLTAEDIFNLISSKVTINLSTIYRALKALSEKGVLLKSLNQDGKTYYQINNSMHTHHLVCTLCGNVIPINHCPLENFSESLINKTGYIITGHSLEFTGICPKCSSKL